jgi:serine protease Do
MQWVLTMSRRPFVRRSLGALLALSIFTACTGDVSAAKPTDLAELPASATAAAGSSTEPVSTTTAVTALPDFASLVERHGPAVVNISTKGKRMRVGASANDPFFDFFRRFGVPVPPGQRGAPPERGAPESAPEDQEGPRRPGGAGSGFIVSSDGYILTNAHVVNEADEVIVKLTDRREFKARIVGLDAPTDVAVLKIEARGLPVVRIGDPSKLRPGEWVLAIGSPFGFDNSATAGIVSATARGLPGGDTNYVNFIQTDVAVNPGNSGGPLFNLAGEVIGINSQIYSRSGGYMGISFAIPIDVAVNVRDQLISKGRVSRGKIGVTIQPVDATLAESFGLDRPRGALVGSVEEGGPAAKGGIRAGDIILSANGRPIERSEELPTVIGAIRPGADVVVEIWRDRASRRLTLRVAELQAEVAQNETAEKPTTDTAVDRLGLLVRELTPEERTRAASRGPVPKGLLVERSQGAARDAGVQRGDFIVGVRGKRIETVKEFRDAVAKEGKVVALLVSRGGNELFVPVTVE